MKRKQIVLFVLGVVVVAMLAFSALYINGIRFYGDICLHSADSTSSIIVTSPLGRTSNAGQSFHGYCSEIVVQGNFEKVQMHYNGIMLTLQQHTVSQNETTLLEPETTFVEKVRVLLHISSLDILILILHASVLMFIVFMITKLFLYLIKNAGRIKQWVENSSSSIFIFLKTYHFRILIPLAIACLPGLLFAIIDKNLLPFLGFGYLQIAIVSECLFAIPLFCIWFHKTLGLNRNFWISYVVIFIAIGFLLLPEFYIYGYYFRDDLSKYFVKVFVHNFWMSISTADAGYLNLFQNVMSYALLKIFGFRAYFPEAMQLLVLISFSLLYSAINLKDFKSIISSDHIRLIVSLSSPIVVLYFSRLLFYFDIPFLAALLFLPILFFDFDRISRFTSWVLIAFLLFFILSKPYFLVFLPFLFIFLIHGILQKSKVRILFSIVLILGILLQLYVNIIHFQVYEPSQNHGLGTLYNNAYSDTGLNLIQIGLYAIYIFVRLIPKIFFGWVESGGYVQLIINFLSVAVLIFLFALSVKRFLKTKNKTYLFVLSCFVIAFFCCVLLLKVGVLDYFITENRTIFELGFSELIQSAYFPPTHRYLLLAYIPLIAVMVYYVADAAKKIRIAKTMVFRVFLVVIATIYVVVSIVITPDGKSGQASLWRQYNGLIFNYPNSFYLPYYFYPLQSECIKYGIDRITDVEVPPSGIVHIDSLGYNTEKWQLIQCITEYEPEVASHITHMHCIGHNNDTITVQSWNPVQADYRFIIFRLPRFIRPKHIIFTNSRGEALALKDPVRLVGLYE